MSEKAAKDPTPVKHGVAQTDEVKEADKGREKAAADPNPVKHGMPTKPAPDDQTPPAPSKADAKRADLNDEFEALKAAGKVTSARFLELKKLLT